VAGTFSFLGERRERDDERELWLKVFDELIVGRDEFATFLLGQSDV
jgi:hypothetical protein